MIDFSISKTAAAFQHEWLTAIGTFLHDPLFFVAIIILIGYFLEQKKDARIRLASSLLLTFILVTSIKLILAAPRPCVPGVGICPFSYSLPSMHAAVSFTLMFAALRKQAFPAILLFALFVSFTRLNLGVHNFEDIAAALPVAFISFFLINNLWSRWNK
jgi:undecaprenyl-diphosphatase